MATDASDHHYRAAQLMDEAKSLLRRGDTDKALLRIIDAIMELALTDEQAKEKRKVRLG